MGSAEQADHPEKKWGRVALAVATLAVTVVIWKDEIVSAVQDVRDIFQIPDTHIESPIEHPTEAPSP